MTRYTLYYLLVCISFMNIQAQNTQESNYNLKNKQDIYIGDSDMQSQSGYIKVHESGSSLFYILHSAYGTQLDMERPLIIWLNGGPGASSMFGNFYGIGPYELVEEQGEIKPQKRQYSWNEKYHTLFVDSPVETGFSVSFKNYKVNTTEQYAQDFLTFLIGFYDLYPKLQNYPLYITGESYVGHYIPAIAELILQSKDTTNILLEGIAIGNGWVKPQDQTRGYSEYIYAAGLGTRKNMKEYNKLDIQVINLIKGGQYEQASDIADKIEEIIVQRNGGELNIANFRRYGFNRKYLYLGKYLNNETVKEQLGVLPSIKYKTSNPEVFQQFRQDYAKGFSDKFKNIINKIPILIFVGQDDIDVNLIGCWEWILNLPNQYFGDDESHIKNVKKQIWKLSNGDVAGTVKILQQFYFAIVYKAGHVVPADAPRSAYEMIDNFIQQKKDWTQ